MFQFCNILLLIPTMLGIWASSDEELESESTIVRVNETFFDYSLNSVKPVITPALPNLKITRIFPAHILTGISWMQHLDSVLILVCLFVTFNHFEEDAQVSSSSIAVSVRINFKSPCQSIWNQTIAVHNFMWFSFCSIVHNMKFSPLVLREKFWRELCGYATRHKRCSVGKFLTKS